MGGQEIFITLDRVGLGGDLWWHLVIKKWEALY